MPLPFMNIRALTTIEAPDHKGLLTAWKLYRGPLALVLVGRFIVKKPLTASQHRRLPKGLRERLK
jgi:hypothetical protein